MYHSIYKAALAVKKISLHLLPISNVITYKFVNFRVRLNTTQEEVVTVRGVRSVYNVRQETCPH